MRLPLAFSLLCSLAIATLSAPASAAPIIAIAYLNSDVQFGSNPDRDAYYIGHDRYNPSGLDETTLSKFFFASLGPLVQQTLLKNQNGTVVQSNYFYSDGLFDFHTFTLPITTFGIWAPEPGFSKIESGPLVGESGGDVYFTLGPGLLDAGLAKALGTSRHIVGGQGAADMRPGAQCDQGPYGDHLSLNRSECDGALWIELTVPEPSLLGLLAFGGVAAVRRRR